MSEDDSLEEESTDLLKKLYKCKFPRMFIQTLARWSIGKGKSRKILPICQETDGCAKATPSQFQRVCTKSGHVVTKTIRANVKMLKPLIKFHGINLKILHLMRDPRGTASSRRSYYTPKKRGGPEGVGKRSLHELGLLSTSQDSKKTPFQNSDQYRLVRYEDLAEDPIRLSQHIYDFIGLELPPVVLKWIHNNTESDNSRSKHQFSTRKNSSRASTSWRGRLSLEEVLAVQDICGDVMASLGYKKLYTQEELENYSLPLVEPIKLDKDLMIM
ncbi:putative carbohydrate sulfotransferase 1-like [Apostichopus japonicus]|uniref:Putative carbohydrate sulfotransferase 1-like n=1 Tax=Stichopus japonicus TaxID=307972 RepID=A0A2G8LK58_STIJA|nr:putative carbohydrate sulfotransferase 1-like [Apostichopus japonicus]